MVLIGLQTGGVPLAARLAEAWRTIEGRPGPLGSSTSPSTATTSACGRCCPRPPPTSRSTSTAGWSCWSTTCCSPGAPCGPPSTPSTTTAGPGRAARGDGRPRATGSCRSARLRRQEPAHRPTRHEVVDGSAEDGVARGRCATKPEAPAVDRRPRARDGIEERARADRPLRRGEPAADPEGAGAAGQDRGVALLRGLHPHPAQRSRPRPSGSRPTR